MDNQADAGKVDLERVILLRKEIMFEHNLMCARLNSFVTAQSFLFAAFAFSGLAEHADHAAFGWFSHLMVPLIGLLFSILVSRAIGHGSERLCNLNARLHDRLYGIGDTPISDLADDLCIPSENCHRRTLQHAWGMPLVCGLAWLFVGVISILYHHLPIHLGPHH